MQHNISLFAHGTQNLAAGQRGADSVSIGTGMRRQHESFALSDLPKNIFEHVAMPSLHWASCSLSLYSALCCAFSPAPAIVLPAPAHARHDRAEKTTPELASAACGPPVRGEY